MLEKMLHHKLLNEGEHGEGVVTNQHDEAAESSAHSYSMLFEIHGHIKFPDGTQTEFKSEWLNSHKVGDIQVGAIVPVRYDPSDHSRVVLDVVALEEKKEQAVERAEAWQEQQKARAIAEADARIAQADRGATTEGKHHH
jgi:regulator of protease activity HflC (stomatin/prohibitin superfamily)